MGPSISMIQKVGSPTQLVTDQIFASLEKDIKNFDEFHIAFLEVIDKFNAAMPGVHYDAPTRAKVEEYYKKWNAAGEDAEKRKDLLTELLGDLTINRKTDNILLFTGLATPPAAMIGKRAAGNFPALNFVKLVPDVLFVPSVTLLAIASMKFARKSKKVPEAAEKKAPSSPPEASSKKVQEVDEKKSTT